MFKKSDNLYVCPFVFMGNTIQLNNQLNFCLILVHNSHPFILGVHWYIRTKEDVSTFQINIWSINVIN